MRQIFSLREANIKDRPPQNVRSQKSFEGIGVVFNLLLEKEAKLFVFSLKEKLKEFKVQRHFNTSHFSTDSFLKSSHL